VKTQEASEVEEVEEVKSLGIWLVIRNILSWIHNRRPLATLLWFIICMTPTSIYISVRYLLEPNSLWQELILISLGIYFMGAVQVFMGFIYILILILIWSRPDPKESTWMDSLP